jgi:hypothetical protein
MAEIEPGNYKATMDGQLQSNRSDYWLGPIARAGSNGGIHAAQWQQHDSHGSGPYCFQKCRRQQADLMIGRQQADAEGGRTVQQRRNGVIRRKNSVLK